MAPPPIIRLVGDLYGCLSGEEPASAALDILCSAIGAAHAIVMRTGPGGDDMFATSHHLAAIAPTRFGRLEQSEEYGRLLANASTRSVVRLTDMVPRDQILRTDMYQTTLRALDGGLAAYGLQADGANMVVTAFCRSAAVDVDFDEDSIALLRAALPHLVAVTGIAARIERERRDGRRIRDALDIVADGVIVLDADGRMRHANSAADVLLVRADRVRRTRTGIAAAVPADDLRLQHAIAAVRMVDRGTDACNRAEAAMRPVQVVLGRDMPCWPLIATILPADRAVNVAGAGAVVVHLRDPGQTTCLSITTLETELGLTAREAMLVHELAHGATLTDAAVRMEISAGTARQYLKTIFLKTGAGRQADLLRLVCR